MSAFRVIARLDIKGRNLIKGIHLEGLRVMGDPNVFARRYYEAGIDELLYMDNVASLYGRNSLDDVIAHTTKENFVPLTVGGGIRSVADAHRILRAGADKVAVNTAAVERPQLLGDIADDFGAQCVVLSIEAKRQGEGWDVLTDNGRERTGRAVLDWVVEGVERGAGEVLLTSVDRDGTGNGFDIELVAAVARAVRVPVIASGGLGAPSDLADLVAATSCSAAAVAGALHYDRVSIADLKAAAEAAGAAVRA
jgi:cyclase